MKILSETLPNQRLEQFNPEIRNREDISTWLAEVLDGSMRSEVRYWYDGQDLRAEDGSQLAPIFEDALAVAGEIADKRPDLAFELRRRKEEMSEYQDMLAMARGDAMNTMIVVSDFPEELMDSRTDVGGYNVARKQTMLRVITRNEETNEISMITQSLDRSDRVALERIYNYMGMSPRPGELLGQRIYAKLQQGQQEELVDRLTEVYDQSLQDRLGGDWHTGRSSDDKRNTLGFVRMQKDLLSAYLLGEATEHNQLNLAAAMTYRFKQKNQNRSIYISEVSRTSVPLAVAIELELAGRQAVAEGMVFSGCGASIGGSSGLDSLIAGGYGNKTDIETVGPTDQYGPLSFECPKGHRNTRPKGKLIDCCKTCGASVKC